MVDGVGIFKPINYTLKQAIELNDNLIVAKF
jgi:hypothetical protein